MALYAWDLLSTARFLLLPVADTDSPSPAAIRRSISTSYYALFHFILAQSADGLVGNDEQLTRRRNIFTRTISHRGLRLAINKVWGEHPTKDVLHFLSRSDDETKLTPRFVREFASVFLDAYEQRQQADYDLNTELTQQNAITLTARAETAMRSWLAAAAPIDEDFKHAFILLIALHGKLRAESE